MNTNLEFSSGSTVGAEVCEDIRIEADGKLEDTEQFTFSFSSTDRVIFTTSSGTVIITDDDSKQPIYCFLSQIMLKCFSGVTVAWVPPSHTVREDALSFMACVQVTVGTLCRDIELTVSTADAVTTPQATSKTQ